MGKFTVALCQFDVSDDIEKNSRYIREFIEQAAQKKADIVHLSECALGGYAGVDFESFEGYNWQLIDKHTDKIKQLAAETGVWVILGTNLKQQNSVKNSLLLINNHGEIAGRYDKRFCTPSDINFYEPGEDFCIFDFCGVKCALLICYDLRFPEIYRELEKQGVECIFQSFYNARQSSPSVHTHIMRQTMQCRAATNYFWVSMTNSCAAICPYPSCFIQPDGKITAQLQNEKPSLITATVNTNMSFYDASAPYRHLAMQGVLTNKSLYKTR